jgi:L-arabinokinase
MIAVYVSGHGFGHSTRTAEVLRQVRKRAPDLQITVTTSAPAFLFEGVVAPPLKTRHLECDVALVQKDALRIDEAATAARCREFAAGWDDLVASEAAWLKSAGARLVLADIPPLAFAAAAAAGLPSVGLSNFSWDWIYGHLAAREPALGEAAALARDAYAGAELLLRLPFAGDLSVFARIEDVPLVARRPATPKHQARRCLGLGDEPVILLSFGGLGLPAIDLGAYGALEAYRFVLTGYSGNQPAPANLRLLDSRDLEAAGLAYVDLVGAVDVVVTKPGYGIVTDCIGAGTRMVYTDRGDFPEYPILSEEMEQYIPAVFANNDEICHGRLGPALDRVRAIPLPQRPRMDGAEVAAALLLSEPVTRRHTPSNP